MIEIISEESKSSVEVLIDEDNEDNKDNEVDLCNESTKRRLQNILNKNTLQKNSKKNKSKSIYDKTI